MNKLNEIFNKNNKIFSLVLGCIGNIIGFSTNMKGFNTNMNISKLDLSKYYTEDIIFKFINNGGLSSFKPQTNPISSEVLFLFDVIRSNNIKELKYNYKKTLKFIEENDVERNLDIITKNSIENFDKISDLYDENANAGFVVIRCIPYGFKSKDIIKKCIDTITLTHNNSTSIIGGISCAILTNLANESVDINKWIDILIEKLEKLDIENLKKINLNDLKKYIDKLKLYLERKSHSKALIYPNIRSDFYHRNFNQSMYIYYGNFADDIIIISYDILLNCIVNEKPSYEKLIYLGCLHLGESSLTGFLTNFWYGLYFRKTADISDNLFFGIEFLNEIINLGKLL
jgi:hypothetical protein